MLAIQEIKNARPTTADAYYADRAILLKYAGTEKSLKVLKRYFTLNAIALALARDADLRLVVDTAPSDLFRSDDFSALYSKSLGEPGEVTLMLFKAYATQ